MSRNQVISLAILIAAAGGNAYAQCSASSPYVCVGGGLTMPESTNNNGSLGSSAQTISGLAGSISKVTVTLTNWTDNGGGYAPNDREFMLVFNQTGGATQKFQFLGGFGSDLHALNNQTLTLDDSATSYAPDNFGYTGTYPGDGPVTNPGTWKPTVNLSQDYCSVTSMNSLGSFSSPAPPSAPCATDNSNGPNESSGGTATFASQFSGSPNGTWTLYVQSFKGSNDSSATLGSWTLTITTQANAANTSTTVTSNATNNETTEGTPVTFTATVTSTSTVNAGTVTFTDLTTGTTLASGVAVSNGVATTSASFAQEGSHTIQASYTGNANFGNSNGTVTMFIDHQTSNPSTGQYCNTGAVTINTVSSPGSTPYPQHITIPTQSGSLSGVQLSLSNINLPNGTLGSLNLLLVDPNGNKFVVLSQGGGASKAVSGLNLTFSDFASTTLPNPQGMNISPPPSGTYLPTDTNSGLTFPTGTPSGPYKLPQSQGSFTFATTFGGATPAGQWSLYSYDSSGSDTGSIQGGYCLTITTSAAASTTTTLTSSPTGTALTGQTVTFTATVKQTSNNSTVSSGTVTFEENGTVLSGPTALNGSGQATFTTSSLSEGIHNISALYSGVSGSFNVSTGSVSIEIDTATTNPSSGVYCNPGGVTISGSNGGSNIPGSPYPSRVNVTNLAGTVQSVTLSLDTFSDANPQGSLLMLQGPTSTNVVFWDDAGGSSGFSSLNLTIADSASSSLPQSTVPANNGTFKPTSYVESPQGTFPAPAPANPQFAAPAGTQTLTTAFAGIDPNGYWNLFLYDRGGSTAVSLPKWCANFTENPPVLSISKSHTGNFTQGDTADTYTITVANPSGPGSTAGTLTLTDTLPPGMSGVSMSQTAGGTGSDWTCVAGTATCTRTTPMPAGESDTITLTVSVSYSAAVGGVTNMVSVSGGGTGTTQTASDPTTIIRGPGYVLTTAVNPTSAGTVTPSPANSPGFTAGHYVPGAVVTLTAAANTGYTFSSWSANTDLASTSANPTTITMNAATENATANFTVVNTQVTINTSPQGLLVSVDGGIGQGAPLVENWQVGSQHTITTTTPQGSAGTQYIFSNWSDSMPISHTITVSSGTPSYTATFNTQYQLTVNASPSAGGTATPTSGTYYASGTVVSLAATANTGYTFSNWTGPVASSTSASTTVTMTAPETVTANFTVANTSVTINTSPQGLLVSVDGGTAAAAPLTESWQIGSQHTITTTSPQSTTGTQYIFANWSDGQAISHTITVSAATPSYTATFNTQYQLTVNASPSAGGTATPTSGTYYASGTVVSLAATANSGYVFSSWTGPVANSTSASTTVTMTAPETVTANFTVANTSVTINTSPQGLLVSVDGGAASAAPLTESWQIGSQHTITTTTPQGSGGTQYVFANWSDGLAISHTITVSSGTPSYTATFNTQYQLTVNASPSAGGTATPTSGTYYASGTVVSLLATANTGYTFSNWTGPVANSTIASTTVTMTAPETVTANFTVANTSVTINTSPQGLLVSVDGGAASAAPLTESWQIGSQHTITTTSPQSTTGTQYIFANWSDGMSISHTITVSAAVPSYTATFNTQYQLTVNTSPVGGGTATPTSGTYYASGTMVNLAATANSGYVFSSWTGPVANSASANTTVTMSAPESVTANFVHANTPVTINTSPQGLLVSVDGGTASAAPLTESWQIASQHTITTTTPQGSAGTQYIFSNWSDGMPISHTITVSAAVPSYTATFNTQYQLTVNTSPAAGGTATPTSGSYYASGTMVSLSATANPGYAFSNWTGPVANSGSAGTTVTMNAPETVTANFTTAGATSLGGSIGLKSGPTNARVWPFIVGNNGPGAAVNAQLTSLTLTQTRGAACTPVIGTQFPLIVGDITPGGNLTGNVVIDFSSCAAAVAFTATVPLSANGGAATGSIVKLNQLP